MRGEGVGSRMMMKEKEREDGKHGCFGQNKVHQVKVEGEGAAVSWHFTHVITLAKFLE